MKIKYEDAAKKRVAKLKNEIEKSISQVGENTFRTILADYFGLSQKGAVTFINLVEKLNYVEAGYDTIPEDWYFKEVGSIYKKDKDGKSRKSETVGHLSRKIFEERKEIHQTIKRFRDLQEDKKKIALKYWPKEYQSLIMEDESYEEEDIEIDDSDFFPSNIANKIIAKRWIVSIETIKKYIKKETAKKPSK